MIDMIRREPAAATDTSWFKSSYSNAASACVEARVRRGRRTGPGLQESRARPDPRRDHHRVGRLPRRTVQPPLTAARGIRSSYPWSGVSCIDQLMCSRTGRHWALVRWWLARPSSVGRNCPDSCWCAHSATSSRRPRSAGATALGGSRHRGRVRSSDSAVSRSTGDTSDGFRRTRLVYHHLDGILIAQCSKPADYKNSGRGRSDWLPLVTLT